MLKWNFAVLLCMSMLSSRAQSTDSLKSVLHKKPVPFISIDSYNSFITQTTASSLGIRGGVEFGGKLKFGIGYYTLFTDIVEKKYIAAEQDTFRAELKSHYFTTGAEYILYEEGPWQISVPVHVGFGNSFFQYYDKSKSLAQTDKQTIILTEATVAGCYKIVRWVGIGFGAGYRLMLKNNTAIHHNFNSPLYYINIRIFPVEIFNTIFKKGESNTGSD